MRWPLISFLIAMFLGLIIGFKYVVITIAIVATLVLAKSYFGVALVLAAVFLSSYESGFAKDKKSKNNQKIEDTTIEDIQVKMIKETYFKISEHQQLELENKKGNK